MSDDIDQRKCSEFHDDHFAVPQDTSALINIAKISEKFFFVILYTVSLLKIQYSKEYAIQI